MPPAPVSGKPGTAGAPGLLPIGVVGGPETTVTFGGSGDADAGGGGETDAGGGGEADAGGGGEADAGGGGLVVGAAGPLDGIGLADPIVGELPPPPLLENPPPELPGVAPAGAGALADGERVAPDELLPLAWLELVGGELASDGDAGEDELAAEDGVWPLPDVPGPLLPPTGPPT